jgi:hypothetical protein
MERNERQERWRDSAWNRARPVDLRPMGRSALALGSAGFASADGRVPRLGAKPEGGAASGLGFLAAPWTAPARRRYRSGNQWLIRILEWMTAKTWPLAVLDDMCTWFEDSSAASRMAVGCAAAATMAALLTVHWAALYGLQSMALLPVFGGHGVLIVVAASFVAGATLLPVVLGHVLGVLLRFYVLLNLCTMAALVGYGGWLLYSYVKF